MAESITHFKYTYKKAASGAMCTASMTDAEGNNIPLVLESSSLGTNGNSVIGYKQGNGSFSPKTLLIANAPTDTIKNLNIYVSNDGETYYQVYFILVQTGDFTLDIGSLIEYVEF